MVDLSTCGLKCLEKHPRTVLCYKKMKFDSFSINARFLWISLKCHKSIGIGCWTHSRFHPSVYNIQTITPFFMLEGTLEVSLLNPSFKLRPGMGSREKWLDLGPEAWCISAELRAQVSWHLVLSSSFKYVTLLLIGKGSMLEFITWSSVLSRWRVQNVIR